MKIPAPFCIPKNVPEKDHLKFCLEVLDKYRAELTSLRRLTSRQGERVVVLQAKLEKSQVWFNNLKADNRKLHKQIKELNLKLEKIGKTNHRYQISLFDHGNFTHPDNKGKKSKGGQVGHSDTNREANENTQNFVRKRVFFDHCPQCSNPLPRTTSHKQKALIDIVLNPQVVKLLLQRERQWCGSCQKQVMAQDEQSLPFSEYGINLFMMVLILRYRCLLSFSKTSLVIEIIAGVKLPKSAVSNLLNQAQHYLKGRYKTLTKAVRKAKLIYNDETGWLVKGKKAWVWIMADENTTIYKAAESRGKGIFKEMRGDSGSYSMHDGYPAYSNTIHKQKQMYCWAHVLRYCFEETYVKRKKQQCKDEIKIRDKLVSIYQLKNLKDKHNHNHHHAKQLKQAINKSINSILQFKSNSISVLNIQKRVEAQKQGLINALVYSPNGTNNLAERELRQMVLLRKNTFGSDTYQGMERDAILASIIQTSHRQNKPLLSTLRQHLHTGIHKSRPNHAFGKS